MTLAPQFSLIHSEFNDFLFSSVGVETNGIELTVLSALTRLGFDPWGEAARLAELPREAASRALAATIALLPDGAWPPAEVRPIAVRLVTLLPRRGAVVGMPKQARRTTRAAASWRRAAMVVGCALAAAMLYAMLH